MLHNGILCSFMGLIRHLAQLQFLMLSVHSRHCCHNTEQEVVTMGLMGQVRAPHLLLKQLGPLKGEGLWLRRPFRRGGMFVSFAHTPSTPLGQNYTKSCRRSIKGAVRDRMLLRRPSCMLLRGHTTIYVLPST